MKLNIDFCSQAGLLNFFKMVQQRITNGEAIQKPVPKIDALKMLNYVILNKASMESIKYLAAIESSTYPKFHLFQTIMNFQAGKGTADDIIAACFLTPCETCKGNLGWLPALIPIATMVAPFVLKLIGPKAHGAFFSWGSEEQTKYMHDALREAFNGNYPCSASPHQVWREIMKPALANDFKNSDPDTFANNWWYANTIWSKNLENSYNIKWDDRSKNAAGNARKCPDSANGSATTAGIGLVGWVLIGGMMVTAIGGLIYKRKQNQKNGQ
jgi:hypothetical protein